MNLPDSFWAMVAVVAPVFIVQVFQFLATLRNAKKSEVSREEIKAQVCSVAAKVEENTQLTHQNTLTLEAAKLMATGAERQGVVTGIEIGKKQATGPAPLGD